MESGSKQAKTSQETRWATLDGGDGAPIVGPRRAGHFIRAMTVAVAIGLASAALFGDTPTTLAFGAAVLTLLLASYLSWRGKPAAAGSVLLVTLTALLGFQTFSANGLSDEVVTAFPCLLVCTSMFGAPRHFRWVLGALIATLVVITLANLYGWHVNEPPSTSWWTLFNLLVILSVTAYFVSRLAGDLRATLARLRQDNQRLSDSHAQIRRLAHHDALTGLPNRTLARDRAEQAFALARRSGHQVALIFLDLDNFKAINDSLGHSAADRLLCEAAARLVACVRAADTVSRQGGDEFLVVLAQVEGEDDVAQTAGRLIEHLAAPYLIDDIDVFITCSIGIAMYSKDGGDFEALLKNADVAMYRAKDGGRNTFRFYDANMNANFLEALHLMSGMRGALAHDEFQLHYQPQFDLRSGRIVGAEALIRWRHPDLGMIPPAKFIPVAERSGLIVEVGRWVLQQACRQAAEWQRVGLAELAVSVNLSPVQFRRDDFERDVVAALADADLAPHRLELELTESMLIADSEQLSGLIRRLRDLGVRFAIDDFGTGYSNLGYLRRFAVERLKIDQSFVRSMTVDGNDESIVRAVIDVAHNLRLQAVAEGVEDAATLARLVELGCEFGQGYLWSPPLAPEDFLRYVRNHDPLRCSPVLLLAD